MARRRRAAYKYFNGTTELKDVRWFPHDDNGVIIPNQYCRPDSKNARFGLPIDIDPRMSYTPTGSQLDNRPVSDWLPLEREIKYLTKPSLHECDWRCEGAFPNGECQCSCGGRNHGRKFKCDLP